MWANYNGVSRIRFRNRRKGHLWENWWNTYKNWRLIASKAPVLISQF